jgi:hypothetical protein
MMVWRSSAAVYPAARRAATIAPAEVPAVFCGLKPRSSRTE